MMIKSIFKNRIIIRCVFHSLQHWHSVLQIFFSNPMFSSFFSLVVRIEHNRSAICAICGFLNYISKKETCRQWFMYNKIELLSYLIDSLNRRKFNGIEIKRETVPWIFAALHKTIISLNARWQIYFCLKLKLKKKSVIILCELKVYK